MLNYGELGTAVSSNFHLIGKDEKLKVSHEKLALEVIKARSQFHSQNTKNFPDLFARQAICKAVEVAYLVLRAELQRRHNNIVLPEIW